VATATSSSDCTLRMAEKNGHPPLAVITLLRRVHFPVEIGTTREEWHPLPRGGEEATVPGVGIGRTQEYGSIALGGRTAIPLVARRAEAILRPGIGGPRSGASVHLHSIRFDTHTEEYTPHGSSSTSRTPNREQKDRTNSLARHHRRRARQGMRRADGKPVTQRFSGCRQGKRGGNRIAQLFDAPVQRRLERS
jgi:hypothetical protein